MTAEQFDAMIERMALAIANTIRAEFKMAPIVKLDDAERARYLPQARAAYAAQGDRGHLVSTDSPLDHCAVHFSSEPAVSE